MPGLAGPGPTTRDLAVEVALAHRRPLRPQLRDGRGDDHAVEHLEVHAAQREQVAQHRAELVGGRLAHGGEAPVLRRARRRGRCRGGSACCRRRRRGAWSRHIRLAPPWPRPSMPSPRRIRAPCVERALQLKAIEYRRVDMPPVAHKAVQKALFGGGTVPGLVLDGEKILGSRHDHPRARASRRPSRRCCPPTRRSASRSSWPRAGATRCSSRSCGACSGRRCGARRPRCPPTARARSCRSRRRSRGSAHR